MKGLLVVVGVVVVAAIVLLVQALCKISRESDDAMDRAVLGHITEVTQDERGLAAKGILTEKGIKLLRDRQLKPESRRMFEEMEADDE